MTLKQMQQKAEQLTLKRDKLAAELKATKETLATIKGQIKQARNTDPKAARPRPMAAAANAPTPRPPEE